MAWGICTHATVWLSPQGAAHQRTAVLRRVARARKQRALELARRACCTLHATPARPCTHVVQRTLRLCRAPVASCAAAAYQFCYQTCRTSNVHMPACLRARLTALSRSWSSQATSFTKVPPSVLPAVAAVPLAPGATPTWYVRTDGRIVALVALARVTT